MTNKIAPDLSGVTQNISQRSWSLVNETTSWFTGNIVGVLIAAGIGTAIALALLGLRSLGYRIIRHGSGDLHWRYIFARTLANRDGAGGGRRAGRISNTCGFRNTAGASFSRTPW